MGKLINRIPGSRLLISSLPGKALRTLVDIASDSTCVLKAEPGKLDIKRHSPSILHLPVVFPSTVAFTHSSLFCTLYRILSFLFRVFLICCTFCVAASLP